MKRGVRFEASGKDSSETDVGRVDICSDDGALDVVSLGEIDFDTVLPCACCGGDVCGVIAVDLGSCFTTSLDGSSD